MAPRGPSTTINNTTHHTHYKRIVSRHDSTHHWVWLSRFSQGVLYLQHAGQDALGLLVHLVVVRERREAQQVVHGHRRDRRLRTVVRACRNHAMT